MQLCECPQLAFHVQGSAYKRGGVLRKGYQTAMTSSKCISNNHRQHLKYSMKNLTNKRNEPTISRHINKYKYEGSQTWIICCGPSVGFFKNNLTVAVNNCNWTCGGSSGKLSKKLSSSSSALSILSAYSPIIQIIDACKVEKGEISRWLKF